MKIISNMSLPIKTSKYQSGQLFPIFEKKKYGYINKEGSVVIEPQFDDALLFYENIAAVMQNKKYGFIDAQGTFVIDPQFDFVSLTDGFSEKFALVGMYLNKSRTKAGWNYVNKQGTLLFKEFFNAASKFSHGLALVDMRKNDISLRQFTYLDPQNKSLNKKYYVNAFPFNEGFALVQDPESRLYGFLNLKGEWHIKPEFKGATSFSNGVAAVSDQNHNVSFIDSNKKILCRFPMPYLGLSFCSDGLIAFPDPNESLKKGYMDINGKVIIQPELGFGAPFSDGRACIMKQDGRYGYIDQKGKIVIKPILYAAQNFYGGLAKVYPDIDRPGTFGYMDTQGKWIWQPGKKFDPRFQNLRIN